MFAREYLDPQKRQSDRTANRWRKKAITKVSGVTLNDSVRHSFKCLVRPLESS